MPFSLSVFSFLNNELDISNMFLFSVQLNPKLPRKQYFLFPCSFIVCNQGAWWWNLINVFGRKWVWQVSALCVWTYPFPLFCAGEVLADAFEWWGWQLRLFFKVQCYSKFFLTDKKLWLDVNWMDAFCGSHPVIFMVTPASFSFAVLSLLICHFTLAGASNSHAHYFCPHLYCFSSAFYLQRRLELGK